MGLAVLEPQMSPDPARDVFGGVDKSLRFSDKYLS
jgi:hypothetical protein